MKKAKIGMGYILDSNLQPAKATRRYWQRYGDKLAAAKSKLDGCRWYACLWECRDYIRINFAGQPERI